MKYLRLQKAGSFKLWRHMVNFWTVVFFAAIAYDFWKDNILSRSETLLAIAAIYTALLAIYSAEKEFRRWHHMHSSMHPGEVYAILWTLLIIALVVGDAFYNPSYHLPAEISASYIAVIGILAITRESKNFYKRGCNKN
jgi:heme/copper-type cytochrome/quinol oxidase subunit 4